MANTDHPYIVRTITEDGILVSEDKDFSEDARWDWLSEVARQADTGEIVQLVNTEDNLVIAETIAE